MAHADGEIGAAEREHLDELRGRLCIAPIEADGLEAEAEAGQGLQLDVESREGKIAVQALVRCMLVDGVLHPSETERLKRISTKVGIPEAKLSRWMKAALIERTQTLAED
jgi:uncharacterized tellurite resistance protein B-like protein